MAQLDSEKLKKLQKGEALGTVAVCFCFAAFVYFIVMFALSWAKDSQLLTTVFWSTAPALLVITVGAAAFCNIRYNRGIEKLITKYVLQVFVENATLMHPEKDSLTFNISVVGKTVEVGVNAYREKIVFDFTVFKRFSAIRQMTVLKIIADKLAATFLRLYLRGASYQSVEYRQKNKTVKVIAGGQPDKKLMKNYLKNR